MIPASTRTAFGERPYIQGLPWEIRQQMIFGNLKCVDAVRANAVCQGWNQELKTPRLWEQFLQRDFQHSGTENPRALYQKCFCLNRNLFEGNFSKCTITPKGNLLASYARGDLLFLALDSDLQIWDLNNGSPKVILQKSDSVDRKVFASAATLTDQKKAMAADQEGTIKIWDAETGSLENTLPGEQETIISLSLTNNRKLISCAFDGTVMKWDLKRGLCEKTLFQDCKLHIHSSCISKTEEVIFLGCSDYKIRILNVDTGDIENTFEGHKNPVRCLSLEKNLLASGDSQGTILVWDLKNGGDPKTLKEDHQECDGYARIAFLQFTGTGKLLSSNGTTVKIWDVSSGHCEKSFPISEGTIHQVNFTDGKLISRREDILGVFAPEVTIRDFRIKPSEKDKPLPEEFKEAFQLSFDRGRMANLGRRHGLQEARAFFEDCVNPRKQG